MTIKLAVANTADKPSVGAELLAIADYLMLNECRTRVTDWVRGRKHRRGLPKVGSYQSLQNIHVYRQDSVGVVERGTRVLMTGGRKGLGKSRRDRRRRGPSRTAPWQLVFDRHTRQLCILIDLHLIARSTTSERWRRPLVVQSFRRLRLLVAQLRVRFPGVPMVVGGDGNLPDLDDWLLGKGWRAVRTPADMGRRHYTQLHLFGDVRVTDVHELHNDSDHDALVCTLAIGTSGPTAK